MDVLEGRKDFFPVQRFEPWNCQGQGMLVPYAQLEGAHKMYFIFNSTNECTEMSVTITVEITNKLLRHVSTHGVSSSGSSLVLAKITYECTEMCKL